MLDSIRGIITYRDAESVVIEANGIGFRVLMPGFVEASKPLETEREVLLYVLLSANLDRPGQPFTLVGFRTPRQREFFETFSGVSGIATRGAVRALASPMEIIATAVEQGDIKILKTLPGIGPGKAKKIVAELQGKMQPFCGGTYVPSSEPIDVTGNIGVPTPVSTGLLGEVQTALEGLGYSPNEIRDHIQRVRQSHPDVTTAEEFLRYVFSNS